MDDMRHTLTVACGQPEAFALFTTGMGTWWDPAHTPDPATFTGVSLGPEVGGEISFVHGRGRYPVGRVTTWEPVEHYAQTFWLGMDPDNPSTLDVGFTPVSGVCTVDVVHGGWNVDNRTGRSAYDDWPQLLGRFAQAAARLS